MGPKTESDLLPEGSFGNGHLIRDQMAKHRFRKVVFTQLWCKAHCIMQMLSALNKRCHTAWRFSLSLVPFESRDCYFHRACFPSTTLCLVTEQINFSLSTSRQEADQCKNN